MSRGKSGQAEFKERPSGLARVAGQQRAEVGERLKQASSAIDLGITKIATTKFVALCVLAFVCLGVDRSFAQMSDAEKANYADALAYCRGDVARPMALRGDKRVLCLDGPILQVSDILLAIGLQQGGLFVVRSDRGDIATTITLADMLLTRGSTVIVNDYCLAICANYLFIASEKTFVPKDALVAWINYGTGSDNCIGFYETADRGAPRLQEKPCDFAKVDSDTEELIRLKKNFRIVRMLSLEEPPESIAVRRILKRKFDATGKYPDGVYWTWNPRYYARAMRTKVLYEAYPESQDEVDAIVERLHLPNSVIHDP